MILFDHVPLEGVFAEPVPGESHAPQSSSFFARWAASLKQHLLQGPPEDDTEDDTLPLYIVPPII